MNPNKYIAVVMSVLVVCLSLVFTSSLATSAYPYTNSQNNNTQQMQRTSQQENIVNRNQQHNSNSQQSTVNTSYQGIGSNTIDNMTSLLTLDGSGIVDNAGFLNTQQRSAVTSTLQKIGKEHGITMAVVTVSTINNQDPGKYANKLIDSYIKHGENGTIVFLQVRDQRQWYISTDKILKAKIDNQYGIEYISEYVVPLLKQGDYSGAYEMYATKTGELVSYYEKNGEPWTPQKDFSPESFGVAGLLAAFVGWLTRKGLISSMSNVTPNATADNYIDTNSFSVTKSNDQYMYQYVTVVPKPKNNNRGGGGITFNSSDGGHGGGGGRY